MKKFGHKSEYEKVQIKFPEALKNGVRSDTFVCQIFFWWVFNFLSPKTY